MSKLYSLLLIAALTLVACTSEQAEPQTSVVVQNNPDDPARWENDIAAFEAADLEMAPPEDALLFVGSSSIRLWQTLKEDMAPMPVIQRGFGGSKLGDCLHYFDRLVTPYNPKAIVIFCGTNDIAGPSPKSAEAVLGLYKEFVGKVEASLPGTPIYFIAISPTLARWDHRQIVSDANDMVKAYSDENDGLFFIDTASALLDEYGDSRDELFIDDKLHLNAEGYKVWTSIIRPVLAELYP